MLILLKIDHFSLFCEAHDSKGRGLMRFAIGNLANEIASKYFINEVLETGEDSLIIIMNPDEISDFYPVEKVRVMLSEIQEAIFRHLTLSVSCIVSNHLMAFFTRLALSINSLLINLKNTVNLDIKFDFYKFNKVINKLETLEEINIKFNNLFNEICDSLVFEKDNKYPALISSIMEYINSINETRLQKSMELLSKSHATVEEICNSVGISNAKLNSSLGNVLACFFAFRR